MFLSLTIEHGLGVSESDYRAYMDMDMGMDMNVSMAYGMAWHGLWHGHGHGHGHMGYVDRYYVRFLSKGILALVCENGLVDVW